MTGVRFTVVGDDHDPLFLAALVETMFGAELGIALWAKPRHGRDLLLHDNLNRIVDKVLGLGEGKVLA